MKTNVFAAALATALSFSTPVINAKTLLNPIVTASRVSQTTDQTLAAVTVITADDIAQSQSQSLPELLRAKVPGLDFSTTGGIGHQTSTFLRGTNSDHVLFLIDGIQIGSATTGSAALELIPLQQIDRIEIIRGPRSAVYGSDAIGGVIHVFTKKSFQQSTASVGFGSHNTRTATAQIALGDDSSRFNIAINHFKTDGFDVTNDSENDNDGFSSNGINISFNRQINSSLNIHARVLHTEGDVEFDNNSFDNVSDYVQQIISLGFDFQTNRSWTTSVTLGQSKDELLTNLNYEDFFNPGTFISSTSVFNTKRTQLHIQNEITFDSTAQLGFGFDYINDAVSGTTAYAEIQRSNSGIYLIAQNKYDRLQIQAAARADNNEAFGSHETGSVAASYDITGDISINVSFGTAFKAPSFNELYFSSQPFNGNPDLKPEQSRTTETGISGHQVKMDWAVRAYHTQIKNLIITNGTFSSVENADVAEIDGIELEMSGSFQSITTDMSLSLINPIDKSSGNILQNRAKQSLKLGFSKTIAGHDVTLSVLAQSARFANSNNTTELAGYAIANLMIEKSINKQWNLKTRFDNIFNKKYSTTTDFSGNKTNNTPISFLITLSYTH